jgi:hypothetical protein
MGEMKLARLLADDVGESHFEDIELPMTLLDDSPPAKPHYFTQPKEAKAWVSLRCPPDWDGGLHPTPRRQIIICTAGSVRVITSLGVARELVPGTAVLLEDTHGKGHVSEVTSDVPFETIAIRLE